MELDLTDRADPFMAGKAVVVAEVMNGKVWTVRPVTVIKDTADEVAPQQLSAGRSRPHEDEGRVVRKHTYRARSW